MEKLITYREMGKIGHKIGLRILASDNNVEQAKNELLWQLTEQADARRRYRDAIIRGNRQLIDLWRNIYSAKNITVTNVKQWLDNERLQHKEFVNASNELDLISSAFAAENIRFKITINQ